MTRPSGSAAIARTATPKSAEQYPTLELLATAEGPAPAALRARIRGILADPVEQLRLDLDLVATAVRGPDPEFAAYRLLDVLRGLGPTMKRVEAALVRAVQDHPLT